MSLIYAVGDVHGCLAKLRTLIARCEQHAAGRPMMFILLGDYIDRGPQSAGVIGCVIDLQARLRGRVVALKGNHEAIALDVVDGVASREYWMLQGGATTLRSYQIADAGELPQEHLDWMRSLPTSYDDGRRFFVHAGIDPEKSFDRQDEHDLVWIREPFLSDPRDYGRLIVHGHTPLRTRTPELRSNRLNIDTAAVFGGPLTAAVFSPMEAKPVAFLQAE